MRPCHVSQSIRLQINASDLSVRRNQRTGSLGPFPPSPSSTSFLSSGRGRIERKWERKRSLQKKLFHGDLRERPLCSSRSESFSPISRRNARIFLLEIVLMLSLLGFGEKSLRHCRVEGFVRDDAFRVRTNREERAAFGVLINTTLQLLQ
ncbi:hypothetical protein MRB53_014651 [Persea americana]|uniref:Uncharacterized protein n=1 Tax=Persea americana TaxID=3435 RepID=A0ACC2KBG6_PERAE|nr:hypothetical protein MRB53_014651 [Persea americana]